MTKEQQLRYIGVVTSLTALAVLLAGQEEATACVCGAALMAARLSRIEFIRITSCLAVIYS